jgi:hypothetical protein
VAPRFTTLMYQVYPSDPGVDALVCFPIAQCESIFPFRDKLTDAILKAGGIRVYKLQGSPLPPDSIFRFYSESHAKSVEKFLPKKHPSFFSRLMNTAEWSSFQKEEKSVAEMIDVEIETSHDFPCIVVHSRIHSNESMSITIEQVAKDLGLDILRNKALGPIKDVVTSNQKIEL